MFKKLFLSAALIGFAHASASAAATYEIDSDFDNEVSLEYTTLSPTDLIELKKKLLQELLSKSQEQQAPSQTSNAPTDPKSIMITQMAGGGARGGEGGGHAIESSSRQIAAAKVNPIPTSTYTSSKVTKALEEQGQPYTKRNNRPIPLELSMDQNAPEENARPIHAPSQRQRIEDHQTERTPEAVLKSSEVASNKTLRAISEAPSVSIEEPQLPSFHAGSGETLSIRQPEIAETIQPLSKKDLLKQELTKILKTKYQTRFQKELQRKYEEAIQLLNEQDLLKQELAKSTIKKHQTRLQKRLQRKYEEKISNIDKKVEDIMAQRELKGKKRKPKNQRQTAGLDNDTLSTANDLFARR